VTGRGLARGGFLSYTAASEHSACKAWLRLEETLTIAHNCTTPSAQPAVPWLIATANASLG
jgi:hypothetical protein